MILNIRVFSITIITKPSKGGGKHTPFCKEIKQNSVLTWLYNKLQNIYDLTPFCRFFYFNSMKKLILLLQMVPMFSFGQNVQLTTNYEINHLRKNDDKPNVIFIMADDIGIGDISSYGAKMIKTPNIDQLAKEGIKFNNYYANGSVCKPTRYSVLTGRYPFRNKKLNSQNWVGDN